MSEFRYSYVEFIDHISRNSMLSRKDGELAFVGEPDEDLIREFHLEKDNYGYYRTSFSRIGETGWRLKFVTPCGHGAGSRGGGAIENAYVFEKAVEYVDLDV